MSIEQSKPIRKIIAWTLVVFCLFFYFRFTRELFLSSASKKAAAVQPLGRAVLSESVRVMYKHTKRHLHSSDQQANLFADASVGRIPMDGAGYYFDDPPVIFSSFFIPSRSPRSPPYPYRLLN